MSKTQYKYNPDSLSYEEVEISSKQRWWKASVFVGTVLTLTTIATIIISSTIPTTKEVEQTRRIAALQNELQKMNHKFDQMETVLSDLQYRDDNIYRVIFEAEPVSDAVRNGGYGGVNRYAEIDRMDDADLLLGNWRKMDSLAIKLYQQSKSYDEIIKLAKEKEQMLASIPAIQPISNEDLTRIASGFGWRVHPIYKTQKMHTGLDFSATTGTEIYATGDGVVSLAANKGNGYGKYVELDHGFSYQTLYGHMSKILVEEGDIVKRGQVIGLVGSTGTSVAPHLHYEVHKNGRPIDPINFFYNDLTPEQYQELIRMSGHANQAFD